MCEREIMYVRETVYVCVRERENVCEYASKNVRESETESVHVREGERESEKGGERSKEDMTSYIPIFPLWLLLACQPLMVHSTCRLSAHFQSKIYRLSARFQSPKTS